MVKFYAGLLFKSVWKARKYSKARFERGYVRPAARTVDEWAIVDEWQRGVVGVQWDSCDVVFHRRKHAARNNITGRKLKRTFDLTWDQFFTTPRVSSPLKF